MEASAIQDQHEQAVQDNDQNTEEEEINTFPGPGLIIASDQFGIHVVASRNIEPGEQICEENPLMISPRLDWVYDPNNEKEPRVCLGCYKKCSSTAVCSRCGWPVCDDICEKAFIHSKFECDLFTKRGILPGNLNFDYFALETLRCLLLREIEPKKWNKFLRHESHVSQRRADAKTREIVEYVLEFIGSVCGLGNEYEPDLIERVMGIVSINSFCMMNDYNRHASLIFHAASYMTHSCEPNMDEILMFHPRTGSSYDQQYFAVKFFAARRIEAGELLTFSYMFNWRPVLERQRYLASYWYFNCECTKCRIELLQEVLDTSEWEFAEVDHGHDHDHDQHKREGSLESCESSDSGYMEGGSQADENREQNYWDDGDEDDECEFGWIGDTIGRIVRDKCREFGWIGDTIGRIG